MNIWQQLGIQSTADIREIKKAYSRRLKDCRPDEKPAEFQALHAAYKQALDHARWQSSRLATEANDGVSPPMPQIVSNDSSAIEWHVDEPRDKASAVPGREAPHSETAVETGVAHEKPGGSPPVEEPRESFEARCRRQQQAELEKVDALLVRREKHIPESWDFLAQNPLMLDDRFNYEMGLAVLQRIAEHNRANNSSRRHRERLSGRVMNHLNGFFLWRDNEMFIRQRLDAGVCDSVLPYLEEDAEAKPVPVTAYIRGAKSVILLGSDHKPLKAFYFANEIQRLFAMVFDIALVTGLIAAFYGLADHVRQRAHVNVFLDDQRVLLIFGFYVAGAWFFECSRWQATPGKMLLGLKVTDANYQRLGNGRGLWRAAVFSITAIGIYLTILLNLFLKRRFIHDRLSKTLVIDYRLSKKMKRRRL